MQALRGRASSGSRSAARGAAGRRTLESSGAAATRRVSLRFAAMMPAMAAAMAAAATTQQQQRRRGALTAAPAAASEPMTTQEEDEPREEQEEQQQQTPSPSSSRRGAVFASVEGAPLLELSAGHHAVPLLEPRQHGVPFAMALRVIHPGAAPAQVREAGEAARRLGASAGTGAPGAAPDVAELHYVLGGSGSLLGAAGAAAPVGPGDCVLAAQGAAVFSVPPDAANLDGSPMPLVMLQVLLPGKMLRDMAGGARTAVGWDPAALGISPEWSAPSVLKAGRVTPELMCRLLTPEAARSAYSRAAAAAAAVAAEAGAGGGPEAGGAAAAASAAAAAATGAAAAAEQAAAAAATAASPPSSPPLDPRSALVDAGLELTPLASVDADDAPHAPRPPGAGGARLPPATEAARPLLKRSLSGVRAWRMPNATNQLALLFSPHTDPGLSMTFGVEMFEPGHRTARHVHGAAYEAFVVLGGGGGLGIDGGARVPLRAGDVAVFPPGVVHAIDNLSTTGRLFCLQMMLPNEMFAEYVAGGALLGPLDGEVDAVAGDVFGTC